MGLVTPFIKWLQNIPTKEQKIWQTMYDRLVANTPESVSNFNGRLFYNLSISSEDSDSLDFESIDFEEMKRDTEVKTIIEKYASECKYYLTHFSEQASSGKKPKASKAASISNLLQGRLPTSPTSKAQQVIQASIESELSKDEEWKQFLKEAMPFPLSEESDQQLFASELCKAMAYALSTMALTLALKEETQPSSKYSPNTGSATSSPSSSDERHSSPIKANKLKNKEKSQKKPEKKHVKEEHSDEEEEHKKQQVTLGKDVLKFRFHATKNDPNKSSSSTDLPQVTKAEKK